MAGVSTNFLKPKPKPYTDTPHPSGYIDRSYAIDPITGRQRPTERINPNQRGLDEQAASEARGAGLQDRAQQDQRFEALRQRNFAQMQQAPAAAPIVPRYSDFGDQPQGAGSPAGWEAIVQQQMATKPPSAVDPQYEDYTDEGELERLMQLARQGFKGSPEMREEQYLDEGLLSSLQGDAERRFQPVTEEYFDDPKSRALGFNRAKDNIGLVNRSALDSLRDEMAATGRLGSGIEAQLGANIIGQGAQGLSQFETDQALGEAEARRGVGQRNTDREASRRSQLAGMLPSLATQARKTRMVGGDPNAVMRQQEQYLAGLMPQLLKQAQKKRRTA